MPNKLKLVFKVIVARKGIQFCTVLKKKEYTVLHSDVPKATKGGKKWKQMPMLPPCKAVCFLLPCAYN